MITNANSQPGDDHGRHIHDKRYTHVPDSVRHSRQIFALNYFLLFEQISVENNILKHVKQFVLRLPLLWGQLEVGRVQDLKPVSVEENDFVISDLTEPAECNVQFLLV